MASFYMYFETCSCLYIDDPNFKTMKSGALKQGHASYLTFILEATKHDTDQSSMRYFVITL